MKTNARLLIFELVFLMGLVLNGCHGRHAPVPATKYDVVNRGTYAYQRVNDATYAVEATNQTSLSQALADIGCGKTYVCLVEREGEVFQVEQRKK